MWDPTCPHPHRLLPGPNTITGDKAPAVVTHCTLCSKCRAKHFLQATNFWASGILVPCEEFCAARLNRETANGRPSLDAMSILTFGSRADLLRLPLLPLSFTRLVCFGEGRRPPVYYLVVVDLFPYRLDTHREALKALA